MHRDLRPFSAELEPDWVDDEDAVLGRDAHPLGDESRELREQLRASSK